jgi:hypothetical protein
MHGTWNGAMQMLHKIKDFNAFDSQNVTGGATIFFEACPPPPKTYL